MGSRAATVDPFPEVMRLIHAFWGEGPGSAEQLHELLTKLRALRPDKVQLRLLCSAIVSSQGIVEDRGERLRTALAGLIEEHEEALLAAAAPEAAVVCAASDAAAAAESPVEPKTPKRRGLRRRTKES